MRILGIDPGSRKTGWAVIEVNGKKLNYIASGVISLDQHKNYLNRLPIAAQAIKEIVSIYSPSELSLESIIHVKNISSLSKLAQIRGALVSACGEAFIGKTYEYAPNLIKSSVSGHGHSSKEGVEKTLRMIFGDVDFKTNDESDALAIALCHSLNKGKVASKLPKKGSRSLKSIFKDR